MITPDEVAEWAGLMSVAYTEQDKELSGMYMDIQHLLMEINYINSSPVWRQHRVLMRKALILAEDREDESLELDEQEAVQYAISCLTFAQDFFSRLETFVCNLYGHWEGL